VEYLGAVSDYRLQTPHAHHLRVQRTVRYYTLGGSSGAPRVIWFVIHGYGQLAGEFIRYFADIAADDVLVVAPEAMNRYYLVTSTKTPVRDRPVGATWMTREDRESEIADYVEYLDTLFEEVASEATGSGARVNVVGFSQGTATVTRWATHGRSTLHRLILWGGLIPPDTDLSQAAPRLRHTGLTLVLGSHDSYIDERLLAAERARIDRAGISYDVVRFDGGHAIDRSVFPKLLAHAE
jgi:predicted esterase